MGKIMNRFNRLVIGALVLAMLAATAGCRPSWQVRLAGLKGGEILIDHQLWEEYADFGEGDLIPLEQILYGQGARIIHEIRIVDQEGRSFSYDWQEAAEGFFLSNQGVLVTPTEEITLSSLEITLSPWEDRIQVGIYDIAPTTASALGIAPPDLATGRAWESAEAQAVLLLFLDGFGYIRYQESLEEGLIPNLAGLEPPLVGLTTYPPITTVSSASLLTGTEPPVHGVELRGIRMTEVETILDAAAEAGLQVAAVEGEALAFNLRNAQLTLSGDRDGNGGTDDNVLANALEVLEGGMPDLFYVHFHGIDDQGHEVGPGALQEQEKIREVDAAVGQILERLPAGTLVIIFADHGMHLAQDEGRFGNHGNLIERDMLIPVWTVQIES